MLVLSANHLINRGANRDCYRHPDDPNRCIKLNRVDGKGTRRDTNEIEYAFHTALAHRLGEAFFQHAPRSYGMVETNLGTGPCFELVRDADGNPSPRFSDYIADTQCSDEHAMALIDRLYDFVETHRIALFDVNLYNMLVRRGIDGREDLVVIDWKGPRALREFIPFAKLIPLGARIKKARRFRRLRDQAREIVVAET